MSAPASPRAPLWNAGFLSLLATQFFEAATDNLIKTSLTLAVAAGKPWEQVLGKGGGGIIGVVFTLPFILFSAWAGRLADRRSKRTITVVLKVVSFGVAALALVGFGLGHPWVAFGALVLFATVSAFFGPAKYGMIAELVDPGEIARANGVVNMATNVAVIAGTLLAGVVSDRWDAAFEDGLPAGAGAWLPGGAVGVLVVLGFLTCLTLPRLRAQDPGLPVRWNPFDTYVATLRLMARGPLLAVALLWTFFYFVAAVVLLVLPDYSEFLHVSNTAVGELMGILGIAIGAGCVAAAWLDRASRRRFFVPAGAIGLAAAIDYVELLGRERIGAHDQLLLHHATQALGAIPGLHIIGTAPHKAGVLSFVLEGVHPHDIGTILDREGVAVRTGHHCAQPVMTRFKVPATSRASFAFYNTRAEVDALVAAVRGVQKVFA